jgi:Family of unknown function (DUF6167)
MRRGLWFMAGAGAGVYASVRARRLAEAFTADGLRDRWHGLQAGARVFAGEAAAGRAERESELRERLGLVPDGTPELAPSDAGVSALDAARPRIDGPAAEEATGQTSSDEEGD